MKVKLFNLLIFFILQSKKAKTFTYRQSVLKYINFMFRFNKFSIFLFLGIMFVVIACKKETLDTYDCSATTPTYSTNIKSIFDNNCTTSGCHSGSHPEAGIDLSTYNGAKANANDNLLGSIEHKSGYNAMPKEASKLDNNTIKQIYCWVKSGAPQ